MYDAMREDLRNDLAREAVAEGAETLVTAGPEDVVRDADDYLPGGMIPIDRMQPVIANIGKIVVAIEQMSVALSITNDRMAAIEKQLRILTPVTSKQVKYLNAEIKRRARELLDKREINDDKAMKKLGNIIRKAVLIRYGVENLREIPKHEYQVALQQIGIWNDMLEIRDVVKEARSRAENSETSGNAE